MKYLTRDFGEVEINDEEIIEFKEPIFGFEEYSKYFLMFDTEIGENIGWLQSAENSELCFIVCEGKDFYKPEMPQKVLKDLGGDECSLWLMSVIGESLEDSTVNLKSPLYINFAKNSAAQVLLEGNYPIKHPFKDKGEKTC